MPAHPGVPCESMEDAHTRARTGRAPSIRFLAAGLLLLLFTAACGNDGGTLPGAGPSPDPDAPVSSAPKAPGPTGTPGNGARNGQTPSYPPADPSFEAELTIEVVQDKGAEPARYRLRCRGGQSVSAQPGAEGAENGHTGSWEELPDADAACRVLATHRKLLTEEPDRQRICTEQYGGPESATVTGSVSGRQVNASFARTNGCEISDWEKLQPLFGKAGTAELASP